MSHYAKVTDVILDFLAIDSKNNYHWYRGHLNGCQIIKEKTHIRPCHPPHPCYPSPAEANVPHLEAHSEIKFRRGV